MNKYLVKISVRARLHDVDTRRILTDWTPEVPVVVRDGDKLNVEIPISLSGNTRDVTFMVEGGIDDEK